MQVSYQQTAADYWAFYRYLVPRVIRLGMMFFVLMALPFLIVFVLDMIVHAGLQRAVLQFIIIGLLGDAVAYLLIRRRVLGLAKRMPGFLGQYTVSISDKGIMINAPRGSRKWAWSEVQSTGGGRRHLFMLIGKDSACIIPRGAFDSAASADQFLQRVREYVKTSGKPA